jgi:hypothetical protein
MDLETLRNLQRGQRVRSVFLFILRTGRIYEVGIAFQAAPLQDRWTRNTPQSERGQR